VSIYRKYGLTKHEEIKLFVVRLYDDEIMTTILQATQSFVSQLKLFDCDQIAKRCHINGEDTSRHLR